MRRLVLLYPRSWRDRYGRELADLLAESPRPWRDGLNVAVYAALAWSEVAVVKVILAVLAAVALVLFGLIVGQLADGVDEIPRHWWSSAGAAAAVVAVAAATVSLTRTSTARTPLQRRRDTGR